MSLVMKIIGMTESIQALGRSAKDLPPIIKRVMALGAEYIVSRAQSHYLTGAALKVQTGRGRSSVKRSNPIVSGHYIYVKVGSNVHYLASWEGGFTVPSYTIVPKRAKMLSFVVGGKRVFAKKVTIPSRTEKARPWLSPAIEDEIPRITRLLEDVGVTLIK